MWQHFLDKDTSCNKSKQNNKMYCIQQELKFKYIVVLNIWLDKTWLHMSNTSSTRVQPRFLVRSVLLITLFSFLCCVSLFLRFNCFVCLPPVYCVTNVASVSGLSIFDYSHAYAVLCFWCWYNSPYIQCIFLTSR